MSKTTILGVMAMAAALLAGVTSAHAAAIGVEATGDSGNLSNTLSASSFLFDANGGNLLVVPLTLSDRVGDLSVVGTYGTQSLVPVSTGFFQDVDYGATIILYLANPASGSNTLSITLSTNSAGGDPVDGDWRFGAISFSNVDTDNPIADEDEFSANQVTQVTLTGNPGAISAGDALIWARYGRNTIGDGWNTPTDGSRTLWNYLPPVSYKNVSRIAAGYAPLVAGDLSGAGGDELILDTTGQRVGANTTLILNAMTSPATPGVGGIILIL